MNTVEPLSSDHPQGKDTWLFNALSPNSDQHQASPCNNNAYSIPEVLRIKYMITKGEFLDILITSPEYFYKKNMGTR